MGDDEKNEYIYKFVTRRRYDPKNRAANQDLLDEGTLYVARFNADGTGIWLELTHGKNGLVAKNGFGSQGDISYKTRQAADWVGATMMDRPEWVAVHPTSNEVFVTLSNNDSRGVSEFGPPAARVDAANPRARNLFGHIIRWKDAGGDAAATSFAWSVFLLAGDPKWPERSLRGNVQGDAFVCPDGLWFDPSGILWIQTDASSRLMESKDFSLGNNMMLAADPGTGKVRRFLTAPRGGEVTGVAMTPDRKTMFVNIQHPGEPDSDLSDPANPKAISSWPDGPSGGRPRPATVVVVRKDGQEIGA
jgi:secreted PhoX family phosphatase